MKKKTIIIFISSLIVILTILLYVILKNNNNNDYKSVTYVNIPGKAGIDAFYPVYYWNNKENVFFMDNNINSCFIAKKSGVEETYYVKESYDTMFMIHQEECKSIKYLLFYKKYMYISTDDYIKIYNLSSGKINRIKKYNILGIYNKKVYYEYNNQYYSSSLDFKDKDIINKIPNKFDIEPTKIKFNKKEK